MNMSIFYGLLVGFAIVCIFIGKKVSKKSKNVEEYFLGKRNFGVFSLALTLLATQLGGGALTGASDEAYLKGWSVLFYPLGMSLGFIALGSGFGRKLRQKNLCTVAQLYEKVYGAPILRKAVSMLSIITLFLILIGQGVAIRKFFFAIGVENPLVTCGIWSFVVVYTVMGGIKAVVYTDVIQTLFIIAVFIATFFSIDKGVVVDSTPLLQEKALSIPWLSWLLMPFLFMIIEQDMGQRCFAAKNGKAISIGAIIASVFIFLCTLLSIYLGILCRNNGVEISLEKGVLMTAIQTFTSPTIGALFGAAFLMVILSTTDSLLCSISSNLVFDFSWGKKPVSSRSITFAIGALAIICSFFFKMVLPLLIQAYELSVCVLFVPTASALLFKRAEKKGAILSMSLGLFGFLLFRFWEPALPRELLTLGMSACGQVIPMLPFRRREAA